ncbi:MAG: hypothetical protein WC854_08090 [Bacteroidales bacterium]
MHFVAEQVKILILCSRQCRPARFVKELVGLKWRSLQFPAFFVRAQAKTRWGPECRALYATEKEVITARVRQFATYVMEQERIELAYPV